MEASQQTPLIRGTLSRVSEPINSVGAELVRHVVPFS
jgi:hypothetical protein